MNLSAVAFRALSFGIAAAVLAACGEQSAALSPPAPAAATSAQHTWMSPGAQKQPSLLYVSNDGTASVTVYTYLNGGGLLQVGTLTGFSVPTGLCADKAGDVWVSDWGAKALYEYAHGGTTRIFTIRQPSDRPYDCAVDLATGDLAVANQQPNGHYYPSGNVKIYPPHSHSGRAYGGSWFPEVNFVAYDNKGDVFADVANTDPYAYGGPLYELPAGGDQLLPLTISGATLYTPGALQWVKPYLLAGDRDFQAKDEQGAYKLIVFGSVATSVGTLSFQKTQNTYAFWRRGDKVIVPDHDQSVIQIYPLAGGTIEKTLRDNISLPFGAAVSQAPQ
ncbi:MAG TPA: hypothetical protein VJP76_02620 [Candidatus Tumulicola sp.]|nr:hypothetical protein [Candidatus Tumulicola sp.]